MKRSDITDLMVCQAAAEFHAQTKTWPPSFATPLTECRFITDILVNQTGAPSKVVYSAMERAEGRGLIECGVSLRTAWLTDQGKALLDGQVPATSPATPHQH